MGANVTFLSDELRMLSEYVQEQRIMLLHENETGKSDHFGLVFAPSQLPRSGTVRRILIA